MKTQTLTANYLKTICWHSNAIIDWASAGKQYSLDGGVRDIGSYHFPFSFDCGIISESGQYAFIYQRLGTKGLLLKNGEELREINRPYYCANSYEFPAAFVTTNGKTYLVHCPKAYNRLDFEDVETGVLVTDIPGRKLEDIFHSRLEVSPNNTFLLSKAWLWHPVEHVVAFNIESCMIDPRLLDKQIFPNVGVEICAASFIDDYNMLIGSSTEVFDENDLERYPSSSIAIWNLTTNEFSKPVTIKEKFGNLFAIDQHHAWDLFGFPKIINIKTGEIIDQNKEIDTGEQNSSVIYDGNKFPVFSFNRTTKQIAIKRKEQIDILTPVLTDQF